MLQHREMPTLVSSCHKTILKSQSYSNKHLFLTYDLQPSWGLPNIVGIIQPWLQAMSWIQACFKSLIPQWLVGFPRYSLHIAIGEDQESRHNAEMCKASAHITTTNIALDKKVTCPSHIKEVGKYTPTLMSGTIKGTGIGSNEVLGTVIQSLTMPYKKVKWQKHTHRIQSWLYNLIITMQKSFHISAKNENKQAKMKKTHNYAWKQDDENFLFCLFPFLKLTQ